MSSRYAKILVDTKPGQSHSLFGDLNDGDYFFVASECDVTTTADGETATRGSLMSHQLLCKDSDYPNRAYTVRGNASIELPPDTPVFPVRLDPGQDPGDIEPLDVELVLARTSIVLHTRST